MKVTEYKKLIRQLTTQSLQIEHDFHIVETGYL